MPYFAMIHWDEGVLSPVTTADGPEDDFGLRTQVWDTTEEARADIDQMPLSQARAITIHDVDGDEG